MVGMYVHVIPIFIQLSDKRINDEMPAEYRFRHFFFFSLHFVLSFPKSISSEQFFCCFFSVGGFFHQINFHSRQIHRLASKLTQLNWSFIEFYQLQMSHGIYWPFFIQSHWFSFFIFLMRSFCAAFHQHRMTFDFSVRFWIHFTIHYVIQLWSLALLRR